MTDPWPLEQRKSMMRDYVALSAKCGSLLKIIPACVAETFGPRGQILPCEVEAETMKHLSEGGEK